MRMVQGRRKVSQLCTVFESHNVNSKDQAGYIDPNKAEEEHIYTEVDIYSYAQPSRAYLEPDDNMNQVKLQVCDEPSSPPTFSLPPCFFIPDLWTGLKV